MAVNALQNHWIVRSDFVQVLLRRPLAAPERLIPAAPRYPSAGRNLADARRDARLRFGERLCAEKVHAKQRESAAEEMYVRVVEAGSDETALEINRALAHVRRVNLARRADGDDAFAVNRDCLCKRAARVRREDFAVR